MSIITVGIDLAKNVFAVHGVDDIEQLGSVIEQLGSVLTFKQNV